MRKNIRDKFYANIGKVIKSHGRCLQGVFGGDGQWSFSYTIGNQIHDLPELLLIGSHQGTYLNELSNRMIDRGAPFANGEIIETYICEETGKNYRVQIFNAAPEAKSEYTIQAGQFFGTENYRVQQVVLSDNDGRLPGEIGCDSKVASIPILLEPAGTA